MIFFLNVHLAAFVQWNTEPCGEEVASCATYIHVLNDTLFQTKIVFLFNLGIFYNFFLWHHYFMLSVIVINPSISHKACVNVKVMSTSSHNWRSMQDPDREERYVSCQMCTMVCATFFSIRKHVNPDKIIDLIKSQFHN